MDYQPFHMSRIGAAHIRRGLPCQDASVSEIYHGVCIAVVADGHGSRRHFRSDCGSAIACRIALEKICAFSDEEDSDDRSMDGRLTELKQIICDAWIDAVRKDHENTPWTEEELDEARKLLTDEQFEALTDGRDVPIAYGSTLCAVFTYSGGWAAIQLGDGCFVKIETDGTYDWLMPKSFVNEGNRTASLCMREPIRDFRHCWGTDQPAGFLVYTDGIEKTFPPQGKEVMSLLHWIWRNEQVGAPEHEDNLARTLDMLTRRSSIGDDVSVAGIVDADAEDADPKPSLTQKRQELERLKAQIAEIESTIEYNEQRLRTARENEEDIRSGAVEQLQDIIKRKLSSAARLREKAAGLRIELGEPEPEPIAEAEPVAEQGSETENEPEWEGDSESDDEPEILSAAEDHSKENEIREGEPENSDIKDSLDTIHRFRRRKRK